MSGPSHRDRNTVRPAALAVALALMAWLLVVVLIRQQPPEPKGLDAPLEQFSAGRALAILEEMQADGVPHSVGSEASERVQAQGFMWLAARWGGALTPRPLSRPSQAAITTSWIT